MSEVAEVLSMSMRVSFTSLVTSAEAVFSVSHQIQVANGATYAMEKPASAPHTR